ncbi:hypothetical protein BGZ61DRAFT_475732 [Ilyonectria robusta]|uniref:uncharacterized protein n=1 Tax=Ilyonectria robusta TaxID=1079257 RepID=UPI001E8CDC54|nr:uncharacterized protein BGZ61DRAFT_475732 [Ilyonectria robusta]KAH8721779.1 hypothetical protein BGZ61DRAFT_475732 [Ilyonectria robusta]
MEMRTPAPPHTHKTQDAQQARLALRRGDQQKLTKPRRRNLVLTRWRWDNWEGFRRSRLRQRRLRPFSRVWFPSPLPPSKAPHSRPRRNRASRSSASPAGEGEGPLRHVEDAAGRARICKGKCISLSAERPRSRRASRRPYERPPLSPPRLSSLPFAGKDKVHYGLPEAERSRRTTLRIEHGAEARRSFSSGLPQPGVAVAREVSHRLASLHCAGHSERGAS